VSERFPRHILVWPVAVQGDAAASQIAAAIRGFNTMVDNKPDVLIVARGGGSLEDLMAFNDEDVVRAAAQSHIPLISAVGHETDTTLIDYAADLRSPTPTGAAERAVPVRLELLAQVKDDDIRLTSALSRNIREKKNQLETLTAKLGSPDKLLDIKTQQVDMTTSKLLHGFEKTLSQKAQKLAPLMPRHPRALLDEKARYVDAASQSLMRQNDSLLKDPQKQLEHTFRMLESLSFKKVLERGYAVVRGQDGQVISDADAATSDELTIQFRYDGRIKVQKT
jgi:exodeoxyribonuclease VII large subunit